MKKIIALVALFIFSSFSSNVFGYDLKINNKTSSEIKISLEYVGPGWCNDDEKFMLANSSKTIKTGICCPHTFSVKGTKGSLIGKQKTIKTSLCRHIFTITQDGSNFKIDDKKW